MLIDKQDPSQKAYYGKMLQVIGSLSNLFSESDKPFLYYRVAENLFCKSFGADNHARGDISADASLNGIGVGLKTFIKDGDNKMEKVAEFNRDSASFHGLSPKQQAVQIATLRNKRIETTMRIYGLESMIYHCVVRSKGSMSIIESPMHPVDISKIRISRFSSKSIAFSDSKEEYSYIFSKSTLFKKFKVSESLMDVPVEIIEDPFEALEKLLSPEHAVATGIVYNDIPERQHLYLPLFSTRSPRTEREVSEGSGLNQWNAGGRVRSLDEVYIPIPAWIHRDFPGFFPPQDQHFALELPNKEILEAKVCQEGGKALMSRHNGDLGRWILRDVLGLKEGELLTYQKLEEIGLDSVIVYKDGAGRYSIDFAKIGSYDSFEDESKVS